MKKIIYFSLPLHGHLNPTIVLFKELMRRGHEVLFYSTEEYREKIEAAGIPFRAYNNNSRDEEEISRHIGRFANKLVEITASELPYNLPIIEKEAPDLVIHDCYAIWGKLVAKKLNVPAISIFTTLMFSKKMAIAYPRAYVPMLADVILSGKYSIDAILRYQLLALKYRVIPDGIDTFLFSKEKLNLVLTSSYFQPLSETFDKTFTFTGPMIAPRNDNANFLTKLPTDKKLIYISLGTLFNDNLTLFRLFIDSLAHTPHQIILSLGQNIRLSDLPKIPSNFIIKPYVPQLAVLQKADLFITHAGMNSINESLYYGVPMILIPQMFEQKLNALRVQQLGAGIHMDNHVVTKEKLLHAVDSILKNKKFYTHAQKLQKTLHDAGGFKKAADIIETYKK